MSATETEDTVAEIAAESADETAAEASEASEAENTAQRATEQPAEQKHEPADDMAVTMSPPGRVEELFDLATGSLARLDAAAESVKSLAQAQQQAVEQSGELAQAFKKTMEEAAAEALASGATTLKKQIEEAAVETTTALESSLASSRQAVEQMEVVTAGLKTQMWRHSLLASLAAASVGLIAVVLAGWLMTWWVRADVEALRDQRSSLTSEIQNLKKSADDWADRFGRAEVSSCKIPGEPERACVRIDDDAGTFRGEKGEHFRVLWGY